MSFKSSNKVLSFSDLELSRKKVKNNTLNHLTILDQKIQWHRIESMLVENYPTGKTKKGPQAYPPLLLFKCLLLRNWFQIRSDIELESLINDRFSFKKFVGLKIREPSPDNSTFSRFKKRLTIKKYNMVLSDVSDQISAQGLIISMGNALDIKVATAGSPFYSKNNN